MFFAGSSRNNTARVADVVNSFSRKDRRCFRKSRNSVGVATDAWSDIQFRYLGRHRSSQVEPRRLSVLIPIKRWVFWAFPARIGPGADPTVPSTGIWGASGCVEKRSPDGFGTATVVGVSCSKKGRIILMSGLFDLRLEI